MLLLKIALTALIILLSIVLLKKAYKKKCKKKKEVNLNQEKTKTNDEHEVGKI